jgi:SAM-dependent methyltransferase
VLDALAAEGHDAEVLDPEVLSTFEDFHTLGRIATVALADLAGVAAGDRVIDLGSGVGGPARFLVRTHGCRVTGIDLTPELCEVAGELNRRTGLDGSVTIQEGDATDLPFEDGAFDLAWTQHVAMNIADKARFYAEAHRVLVPGGRLALFDIVEGNGDGPIFPVPWADEPSVSHLVPTDEVRRLVQDAGFAVIAEEDPTEDAAAFFRAMAGATPLGGALGVQLLIPNFQVKAANLAQSFEEGRLRLLRMVANA